MVSDFYVIKNSNSKNNLIKIKLFKHFIRIFESCKSTVKTMFLSTHNLNEGSNCRTNCVGGKKRDLYEGQNVKVKLTNTHELKSVAHVNSTWQKLRK
jgi:hypothetical protein